MVALLDCFCQLEDFWGIFPETEFGVLFRCIQNNQNEFEFDKKASVKFRVSYINFFEKLILSVTHDNFLNFTKTFIIESRQIKNAIIPVTLKKIYTKFIYFCLF